MPATVPSSSPQLLCACLHLGHSLALGVYMSLAFRVHVLLVGKDAFKALLDGKAFKVAHAAQLNNTEWTPYYVVALLYLHTQGAGQAWVAYLSILGCVSYTASKIGLGGKPAPLSATARYLTMAALTWEVYQTGA